MTTIIKPNEPKQLRPQVHQCLNRVHMDMKLHWIQSEEILNTYTSSAPFIYIKTLRTFESKKFTETPKQ